MRQLLRNDVKFTWTEHCSKELEELKAILISNPILKPPLSVQETFLRFRTLMQEFLPIEILVLMALIIIVLFSNFETTNTLFKKQPKKQNQNNSSFGY